MKKSSTPIFQSLSTALLLILVSITSQSAFAVSVLWTLQDVAFDNGSAATGSFEYDRDTNAFSNIAISLSAGTDFAAQTFDAIAPNSGNWLGVIFTTLPLSFDSGTCDDDFPTDPSCGTHAFSFSLSPSEMTNAGGTISLAYSVLSHCSDDAACNDSDPFTWSFGWDYSNVGAGSAGSISSVPVPAAFYLFGSGLLGLIGIARRKKT